MWMLLVSTLVLGGTALRSQDPPPARGDCRDWQECRTLAAEAAGRKDYETFHDLAWRAVQKGPPKDPALLYALARAQSLSGRPGDALVMIGRLTDMGIATEAATEADLERMRALAGWPPMAVRIENLKTGRPESPSAAPEPARSTAVRTAPLPDSTPRRPLPDAADAARFTAAEPHPAGLAYDAVSRRFVVASREGRKLSVVDEFSHHMATLSGEQAGFGDIAALEIDPVVGTLWVVSSPRGTGTPTLHKLQLVSGRVISTFQPARADTSRFVDVAVAGRSTVLALDGAGGRLMRLRPGAAALEAGVPISETGAVSLAPSADGVAYIAHAKGIGRVDLSTGAMTAVKAAAGLELSGVTRIRWYRGALIGLQQTGDACRAVRISLDRAGTRATAIADIDPGVVSDAPNAAAIAGDVFYYLARTEGANVAVRRITLK